MKIKYQEVIKKRTEYRSMWKEIVTVTVKYNKKAKLSMITSVFCTYDQFVGIEKTPDRDECIFTFDRDAFLQDFPQFKATKFLEQQNNEYQAIRDAVLMVDLAQRNLSKYIREATKEETDDWYSG